MVTIKYQMDSMVWLKRSIIFLEAILNNNMLGNVSIHVYVYTMLAENIQGDIILSFKFIHYFAKQNHKYNIFCIRPFSCKLRLMNMQQHKIFLWIWFNAWQRMWNFTKHKQNKMIKLLKLLLPSNSSVLWMNCRNITATKADKHATACICTAYCLKLQYM